MKADIFLAVIAVAAAFSAAMLCRELARLKNLKAVEMQQRAILQHETRAFRQECERRQRMAELRGYSQNVIDALGYDAVVVR